MAGTPGVLTPRCSATRIHCKQLCGMDRHVIQAQRPPHPPTITTRRFGPQEFCPFCVRRTSDRTLAGGHVNGCTRRCRRRHKQCPPPERATPPLIRHERMAVAMPLAESTRHSAPRGQKKAGAGEGVRGEAHGQAPDEPPPQKRQGRHCGIGFELVLDTVVPELGRGLAQDRVQQRPLVVQRLLVEVFKVSSQDRVQLPRLEMLSACPRTEFSSDFWRSSWFSPLRCSSRFIPGKGFNSSPRSRCCSWRSSRSSFPGNSSSARAEKLVDERLAELLEQRHPEEWAVTTDPCGRTYFWHRRSRRRRGGSRRSRPLLSCSS